MTERPLVVDNALAALDDPSSTNAVPDDAKAVASDLRAALRHATTELHGRLDRAPDQRALLERDLTLERYAAIMAKHHHALAIAEAVVAALEHARPHAMAPYQQRLPALEDDLAMLGTSSPSNVRPEVLDAPSSPSAGDADAHVARGRYLGTRYVLEGSTLGAATIARRLERHLPTLSATAFGYWRVQADQAPGWKTFAQALAVLPARGALAATAIAAARDTFGAFLRAFGLEGPESDHAHATAVAHVWDRP